MAVKQIARRIVAMILWRQVKKLRKRNDFKVVAVAGSIGKTSTKLAIAKVLSQKYRVQFQEGNYNDLVTVPLIFFGSSQPSLYNPLAWLRTFAANAKQLKQDYPFDVVVVEVGTGYPGNIAEFKPYLMAEIGVISGIAPEHMEFFKTLDNVAEEELTTADFCSLVIANKDLSAAKYIKGRDFLTYSLEGEADYSLAKIKFSDDGTSFDFLASGQKILSADHEAVSEPQLYFALAALAVGLKMGLSADELKFGLDQIKSAPGRMQVLAGVEDSRIIDDTYNASPEAVKASLLTLYRMKAPQKIALLGNMNELGEYSNQAHKEVGEMCDPEKVDLVVTLGPDANKIIAPTASKNGCEVHSFDSPYEAGDFIRSRIKSGALILAKGSESHVFAEEAVKKLLASPADSAKLVRQSEKWMKIKNSNFKKS